MDNAQKIQKFLQTNKNQAFTSKRISKNTRINIISVRRTIKKLIKKKGKNRVYKTNKKIKGTTPLIPFYHKQKEQEIIKYVM
jgi:hypothetical protein